MAHAIKNTVAHAVHKSSDEASPPPSSKYLLQVTAGPSYDETTQMPVRVNTNTPTIFENEFMTTKINVRIHNYRGLPRNSPETCAYFQDPLHKKDQYSIGFSFVPKKDLPALHTVWGTDFANPIRDRLPPGFNTAVRIVKDFIDPGISCDAYADKPWLYAPSLSTWFTFRIGEDQTEEGQQESFAQVGNDVLYEGADGSGQEVRRQHGMPEDSGKRRKHFLNPDTRQDFVFQQGRVYHGDFFNPYIDFNTFSLRLPGFSLSIIKYVDDKTHTLRWVFKNRETEEVYFCVIFTLLYGEALEKALAVGEETSTQATTA